jgi:hypothetical protein
MNNALYHFRVVTCSILIPQLSSAEHGHIDLSNETYYLIVNALMGFWLAGVKGHTRHDSGLASELHVGGDPRQLTDIAGREADTVVLSDKLKCNPSGDRRSSTEDGDGTSHD